ncbi:MAG: RNA polymerase sigma-70 factor [Chitinophagaceae bacterium]|nr:RNA polymerase sigma-70 factor [Chitinophagaceae bacterium]
MSFTGGEKGKKLWRLQGFVSQGDEGAFREIFDLYFTCLSQFAFSLVKSKEAATDVVDEVFIRLWNNRSNITAIQNLKVYLYQAVKNSSLNYLSRRAHLHIYEPFDDISIQLKDDHNPERLMITTEILQRIRESVDTLPPRCKMIFKLVREDGLSYKEVAEVLNLSVKTVDAQMVIAVGRIREMVKGHLDMSPRKAPQKK